MISEKRRFFKDVADEAIGVYIPETDAETGTNAYIPCIILVSLRKFGDHVYAVRPFSDLHRKLDKPCHQ